MSKHSDPTTEYVRALAGAGLDDISVLRRETAERVLTKKRAELIEQIATGEVESIRDLARRVDRDVSIVSRDLDILSEARVVEFEEDGRAKRPTLAHKNIFIEPVVFAGQIAETDSVPQ